MSQECPGCGHSGTFCTRGVSEPEVSGALRTLSPCPPARRAQTLWWESAQEPRGPSRPLGAAQRWSLVSWRTIPVPVTCWCSRQYPVSLGHGRPWPGRWPSTLLPGHPPVPHPRVPSASGASRPAGRAGERERGLLPGVRPAPRGEAEVLPRPEAHVPLRRGQCVAGWQRSPARVVRVTALVVTACSRPGSRCLLAGRSLTWWEGSSLRQDGGVGRSGLSSTGLEKPAAEAAGICVLGRALSCHSEPVRSALRSAFPPGLSGSVHKEFGFGVWLRCLEGTVPSPPVGAQILRGQRGTDRDRNWQGQARAPLPSSPRAASGASRLRPSGLRVLRAARPWCPGTRPEEPSWPWPRRVSGTQSANRPARLPVSASLPAAASGSAVGQCVVNFRACGRCPRGRP